MGSDDNRKAIMIVEIIKKSQQITSAERIASLSKAL
jgi:repressor of nif and glnA expression